MEFAHVLQDEEIEHTYCPKGHRPKTALSLKIGSSGHRDLSDHRIIGSSEHRVIGSSNHGAIGLSRLACEALSAGC